MKTSAEKIAYIVAWAKKNRAKRQEHQRRWREKHPEKMRAARENWNENNPEKRRQTIRANKRRKLATDPIYRLVHYIRCQVRDALRHQKTRKVNRTLELLGTTKEGLKAHLEKQFQPGMSWDNHSQFGWHIDHIRPCASFDLTDPAQQRACFHYTNLQPLWWLDNQRKYSKWQEAA